MLQNPASQVTASQTPGSQVPARLPLRQKFDRDGYAFCEGQNYRAAVIFCITARVGSTALMSSFAKAIGARDLPEIFNPRHPFLVLQQKYQARSLQEYVNKYHADHMNGDEVVFKTNFFDMFYFLREQGLPLIFPRAKFVYIHRSDMVAQAYSLWKANKYQVWHSKAGGKTAPEVEIEVDAQDRIRILKIMNNLTRECGQWEMHFRRTRAEVTSVSYEEIDRNLPAVLRRVHQFAFATRLPEIEIETEYQRTSNARDAENIRSVKEYIAGL